MLLAWQLCAFKNGHAKLKRVRHTAFNAQACRARCRGRLVSLEQYYITASRTAALQPEHIFFFLPCHEFDLITVREKYQKSTSLSFSTSNIDHLNVSCNIVFMVSMVFVTMLKVLVYWEHPVYLSLPGEIASCL